MALIIGIIVGALGFIALGGFLVYYVMKRKRMEADRLAEEDPEDDMTPVSKFATRDRPNASKKRKIE